VRIRLSPSARSLRHNFSQSTLQVRAEICKTGEGGARLHIDDEIQRVLIESERLALTAIDLASPALQSISDVCLSQLLRRGNANARMGQIVASEKQHTVTRKPFAARLVNREKLATLRQSSRFGQTLGPRRHSRNAAPLDREALAALPTPTREHGLTIFGAHANEKAVRPFAAAVIRLVRALHYRQTSEKKAVSIATGICAGQSTAGQTGSNAAVIPNEKFEVRSSNEERRKKDVLFLH